ncbi:MAG TPA: cytochrome P450 [Kofleriaceae bacterium]|nr:cytochrome P450 [Kofleriaceae bacterium]
MSDDLLAPAVLADPHAYFRRLAEEAPVQWNDRWGGWIVTRYADVVASLHDARLSSDPFTPMRERMSPEEQARWSTIFRVMASGMVYRDPPVHTRLRGLVSKAFTRGAIERVQPRIQPLVDDLLDRMAERGTADLVHDFAYPLPVTVIAQFIGVSAADNDLIKGWSDDMATLMLGSVEDPERHDRASRGMANMAEYFRDIVRERRRAPQEDLASALVAARDRQELLSEDELVAMCVLLVFAGHETTTNLIVNGVLALFDDPGEHERLKRAASSGDAGDQALFVTAVEELLRFDGPMKAVSRRATAPFELGGHHIEAGQRLLLVLTSANRDPARFAEPDRLDLGRRDNPHLAFGYGSHYCLGAPLARIEAQIALASLSRRFPAMRLAIPRETLQWQEALLIRAVREAPMVLT